MNSSTSAITVSQLFALHIELHYWNITITNTESTEAQMYKKAPIPNIYYIHRTYWLFQSVISLLNHKIFGLP